MEKQSTKIATIDQLFFDLENNRPFAKIAFEGFAGDGKTFTAASLAVGLHKLIKSEKPIAVIDTERAIDKLKPVIFDPAGVKVKATNARSLATVNQIIQACSDGYADILLIDSITHVWENFLAAYMTEKKRTRLEFQDWGVIKPRWKQQFSDVFVMASCHIIFTGRAGFEYENELNEETGKREIFKSGIKMKAETETQFEPDILVLMQKQQRLLGEKKEVWREATIIKDRTTQIDGKTFRNPTFDDFYPAVKQLLDGELKKIHGVELPDTFRDFENRFSEIAKKRAVLIEDLEGVFQFMGLGTAAKDKQLKAGVLRMVYGVHSMAALEQKPLDEIEKGAVVIREFVNQYLDYQTVCSDTGQTPNGTEITNILRRLLGQEEKEIA